MYGYWDRKDEDKGSLVSRVDGLAKIAGIIGLGIASRPYWSRLAGKVGVVAAEGLGGRLIGRTPLSAVKNLFGSEFSTPFFDFSQNIRKMAATTVAKTARSKHFMSSLEAHVEEDSLELFKGLRQDVLPDLAVFSKIGSMEDTEVESIALNPHALKKLKGAFESRGVKFKEPFQRNYRNVMESILSETTKISPTKAEIDSYLYNEANHAQIKKAFESFWERQQQKVQLTQKFIDHGPDWEHVTGAHLLNEKGAHDQVYNAVNDYLRKVGVDSEESVQQIINKAKDLWSGETNGIIGDAPGSAKKSKELAALEQFFQDKIAKTQTTGLIYNKKTGQVLSTARVHKEKTQLVNTLLDELQIPLVPFKFNIPLKMFRLTSPTTKLVRDLGNLGSEPELRRELESRGFSRKTINTLQGLGIDDKLMTFGEEPGSITYHDKGFKRIKSFERRKNQNISNLQNIRSLNPKDAKYLKDFGNAEDAISPLERKVNSILPNIGKVEYDSKKGGFIIQPKDGASAHEAIAIRGVFGEDPINVEDIHPSLIHDWLSTHDLSEADYGLVKRAQKHVLKQVSSDRKDISKYLSTLHDRLPSNSPAMPFIRRMIDTAGDPREFLAVLDDLNATDPNLYGEISPGLFRAKEVFEHNPESAFEVTQGQSGFLAKQQSDLLGHRGIGTGMEKAQEGLLSHIMREHSIDQLAVEIGGGSSTSQDIINELKILKDNIAHQDPFALLKRHTLSSNTTLDSPLKARFMRLGLLETDGKLNVDASTKFLENIFDGDDISRSNLGRFAVATLDTDQMAEWLLTTHDITERTKIIKTMADAINTLDGMDHARGVAAQISHMQELTEALGTREALRTRFSISRPFVPAQRPLSPLNINNFYTVTDEGFNLIDLFNNPHQVPGVMKQQLSRGFGIPEFLQSLADPDKALGSYGAAVQMLVTMPQNIANDVGLGLRGQDRLTTLRTVTSFYGKRILPAVVAYEAYKNYNANMHALGLPGIDDMAANVMANINLTAAGVKDTLGLTSLNQWGVGTLPGLDQYFHPRSRKEYEEYLKYGNEEVREGRGWLIGSRSPLTGGAIKYIRPNAYRRWKSHWTEADNVDISNPHYSYLPNLQNPLAPISLLFNPDWWEEKHRSDRPYLPGGIGTSSPNQWAQDDNYTTINSNGSYGALAIGEIGGGYPIAMRGGGSDVLYDLKSESLVTGAQGTGGIAGSPGMGPQTAQAVYYGKYQSHTYGLEAAGKPIRLGLHKAVPESELQGFSIPRTIQKAIGAVRTQAGLYGAIMQRSPFYPVENLGFQEQDPGAAHSFSRSMWMGEYGEASGPLGEFVRRFVTPDTQGYDSWNPLPNNMPSWLPEKFKTGDPYMRTPGIGELQLPGDAWERTHPWVAPMRVRGSQIGLSEKEMIQKWLNPTEEIDDQDSKDIVDFGSAVHLRIQRQLREMGALIGAEVSIFDKENNLSGTLDAIVRGPDGPEILEFKTQGEKNWGSTPDKYRDQLTFYMHTTGIKKGTLVFINRDNPQQTRLEPVEFDPDRWARTLQRIETARGTMKGLVDKGLVSPFESYDLVSRIEILAKVAPGSPEFRDHVAHALEGGLGGFEKQRVEQAIKEANKQQEDYNLYPQRYGIKLTSAKLKVDAIGSGGEIITEKGILKLAGVEFDPQAFVFEDAETVLGKYGIKPGQNLKFSLMPGQLNEETMTDITTPVIVGDVNSNIIKDGYGNWSEDTTRDPLASRVRYGNSLVGRTWEGLVHSDNVITNKFMRVRTALEQFERGEVYGTDKAKWDDPIGTIITPTINSLVHKDPITAGLQGAFIASMFARTNAATSKIPFLRTKLAIGGAVVGAALATLRTVQENVTNTTWTPSRYREQAGFDEYWDILKFMKYTAIAERAKQLAKTKEKIDIDALADEERQTVGLGPYAVLAIDADRKAKRTMYGYDAAAGTLQDALSTLPSRQKQIAKEIVLSGSLEEKQRFYDLLPDAQRRVLGKFLNVEEQDSPRKPNLTKYFETHFLPNVDWAGWSRNSDMNDLEARSAAVEGMKVDKPNRARVSKARSVSRGIPIPRMDNPTYGSIRRQIKNLLSSGGYHGLDVDFRLLSADSSVVNVDMQLFDDQTNQMIGELKNQL